MPLAWSANGMYLVVGSDSGAAWVLDVGRVEWQPLLTPIQAGNPAAIRWSPDGRLAIVNGGWLTIHSFDDTPDRKVSLPGSTAAWSPDGRSLASVAEGSEGERVLWVTDAWGTGESRRIAALRAADWERLHPSRLGDALHPVAAGGTAVRRRVLGIVAVLVLAGCASS